MTSADTDDSSGARRGAHPTIDDVARLAGVSKGTVSHVISGRVPVAPATRAQVEEAIATLDYRPAETARSLTARKRPADPDGRLQASVPRLTAVGFLSVDYTASLDRLPEREERRLAATIGKSIGGPAANVAAIAAGIGSPFPIAASLITAIGLDQDSDWATAELAHRRVDLIIPRDRRNGRLNRALVLVEADGRRTIISEPSSLAAVDVDRFIETTDPQGLRWCMHLEGYHVAPHIERIARARQKGFRTSMQATGLPEDWLAAHADDVFNLFDVVVLHRETLRQMTGAPDGIDRGLSWIAQRAAKAASDGSPWPELVVVTLGADGAAAIVRGGSILTAPSPRTQIVDATGAGDAFVGCLLATWLNDCPIDLSLRLACVAGSLQVTQFGAQEMRPTAAQLLQHIEAGAYGFAGAEPEKRS
ncbi:MAG: hypothetical protein CTY25_14640 [Methylobacterium sp.]|nr:MAG: hypothetical protein CTY25_14640 [Methylobacterium sp.]